MTNIHSLTDMPPQYAIDSIANYQYEIELNKQNYTNLLKKLKNDMYCLGFVFEDDNQIWMLRRGNDYLSNPKLFVHTPLTYICIFLTEVFKEKDLNRLATILPPATLQKALQRLNEFRLH